MNRNEKKNLKTEKLIIVGKTGSGKDYLLNIMKKMGLKFSPKFTSRPKREGEVDCVDYNFITNEIFESLLTQSEIKYFQKFEINNSTWVYGITKDDFDRNQLFIMTPHEISQMELEDKLKCFIVYLDIDEEIRRQRLIDRNDSNDSIERRLSADNIDFQEFDSWDLKITDPEFDADLIYDLMC